MPTYSATILINATPPTVFSRIADIVRHGDWSSDPLEITATGADTFRSSTRSKGKAIDAELTIVERDEPKRLAFDATDLTGSWRHTFTLTPSGDATNVRRTISGRLSGAQLALFWLVLLPVKKPNAVRALRKLKAIVEKG